MVEHLKCFCNKHDSASWMFELVEHIGSADNKGQCPLATDVDCTASPTTAPDGTAGNGVARTEDPMTGAGVIISPGSVSSQSDELRSTTDPTEYGHPPKELPHVPVVNNHWSSRLKSGLIARRSLFSRREAPCAKSAMPGGILVDDSQGDHNGSDPGNTHAITIVDVASGPRALSAHLGITFGAKIENKAGCATERFGAGNPKFLFFDMSFHLSKWIVARWFKGAVITFSIDYDSFLIRRCPMQAADFALFCLQQAAEAYNILHLGVTFEFVPPGSGSVVFQLTSHPDIPLMSGALAYSFAPITAARSEASLPLYVFDAAFYPSVAGSMTMTFMHELAHILGGRHPSAGVNEPSYPSVELGPPDDVSILATGCHPRTLFLHENDIESLETFYDLPEGSSIEGHPVYEVVPCTEHGRLAYLRRRTPP